MTVSTILLYVLCIAWGVLCGAIVYEHLAVIPVWTKQPPASLSMWRGEHRIRAERFWQSIHPTLILLLLVSLATGWGDEGRRRLLLWTLGGYAVVIAVTAVYFVPELLKLTRDPDAKIPADEWGRRAKRWELLCFPRSALCIALAIPLLRALAQS